MEGDFQEVVFKEGCGRGVNLVSYIRISVFPLISFDKLRMSGNFSHGLFRACSDVPQKVYAMTTLDYVIRPYESTDSDAVVEVESIVKPYLPEHENMVQEMYRRALLARDNNDPLWMPQPPPTLGPEADACLAFWVAELEVPLTTYKIVGTVGVYSVEGELQQIPQASHRASEWLQRQDVSILDRLRVVEEMRRQGVATKLIEASIQWFRQNGFGILALNTTPPQIPAIELYKKFGFKETLRSFVGRYELVWFELPL